MSFAAVATGAGALLAGGIGGGGGGAPAPVSFAPANIAFGSVNIKSEGAGDRGKVAGAADPSAVPAFAAVAEPARSAPPPAWLVPVLIIGGLVAVLFLVRPRRK